MWNKKKRFTTKTNIKWKIIDTIFFIIVFIYSSRIIFIDWDNFISIYINTDNIIVYILWTIIVLFFIFMNSIPYILLYLGARWAIKKYNRTRVTFNVDTDLEYYREKFNGVSPATMSLLMDLSLETEKDLGAMKLYYELNNIYLYEKDGGLYLNNPNGVRLNKSDDLLLNYFYKGKKDIFVLSKWRENVICETINNNLIKRKSRDEKKKSGCGVFLFIHLLALGFIIYLVSNSEKYLAFLDEVTIEFQDNLSILNFIANNPDYIFTFVMCLSLVIALLVYFWSFVSGIIYFIVNSFVSVKDKFKRTNEGNVLAEKLYGMKNFIHDFSNLDEATKKHLILWKEFLIYAVVLEENDIILKEISTASNMDLLSYKNYRD